MKSRYPILAALVCIATALGSWFVFSSVPVKTSDSTVEIQMVCRESGVCYVATLDGNPVDILKIPGKELFAMTQEFDRAWRAGDPSGMISPILLAEFYIIAGVEYSQAYVNYAELAQKVLAQDSASTENFAYFASQTLVALTHSQESKLVALLEDLYILGKTQLIQGGFDTSRRYRGSDELVFENFPCDEYPTHVITLAFLGKDLDADDQGMWSMHAADASLACFECDSQVLEVDYRPNWGWALYQKAGLFEEEVEAANEISQVTLTASLMIDPPSTLNVCQQTYVDTLQRESDAHTLIEEAIQWQWRAGLDVEERVERLENAAVRAEQNDRPGVATIIRQHLRPREPEDMQSSVLTMNQDSLEH